MGLTKEQYNHIMRGYQRQQAQDQRRLHAREAEIYERFPEFAQIDAQIASAGTACARQLLSGEDGSVRRLRAQIESLSQRRTAILLENGYPADYLAPDYRCPDCRDTGYVDGEPCHCFRQAAIDLLYAQANLPELFAEENFDAFCLDYYPEDRIDPATGLSARQTAARALRECRRFVQDFDRDFGNLFLYGDTGLGKTFLAHCIAGELLASGHPVAYFTSFRLFELFADSSFGRKEPDGRLSVEQYVFDCDLLIIDDLGTELVNSFVSSELFHIVNERIQRKKSTLISTNLSLAAFADIYSERTFSRISSAFTMLKMIGDDIRLRKAFSHAQP